MVGECELATHVMVMDLLTLTRAIWRIEEQKVSYPAFIDHVLKITTLDMSFPEHA